MALTDAYIQTYGQLPEFFNRLSQGQAPEKFTRQHLKDLGFASTNFNAAIPLLKALGFLTADGVPTARYHAYRNGSLSKAIMGEALREAYGDLFTIKATPTQADRKLIEGKFKSAHNTTDRMAQLMAATFYSLLGLADMTEKPASPTKEVQASPVDLAPGAPLVPPKDEQHGSHRTSLHYNIQIHLPATKDVEVFNAIFKSLREHLLD